MTLKINPILATLIIAGILILIFALFKGCNQSKLEVAAKENVKRIADSINVAFNVYKVITDSTQKAFKDSLEFERGQNALLEAQKQRTENDLDRSLQQNKILIAQHKLAQYADTNAVTVPNGFITECNDCFTKLETTTNLTLKYKSDYNKLQDNWNKQDKLHQTRLKEIEIERSGFNNKISALTKQQQEYIDKLKPHGRLYLSWGVLWKPFPWAAGAGVMYQNKRNLIYGVKAYYGTQGTTIETTINFPLSLKF